jgi:transposase
MLLVGYFERIDSQWGIAWRRADSLSLRQFLEVPLGELTPDHSTLTNTRNRLPQEAFDEVFQFVLSIAVDKKLLSGKTVGVGSTTLEANAAMKSIVRRDTGENWKEYVTRLMREDGTIAADCEPTDEEVCRYDKNRKNKRVSNEESVSDSDAESRITQMKDGRTHLAYKAEHVADLKSDIVLAAEIRKADEADTDKLVDSVMEAQNNLKEAGCPTEIEEVAADKGSHAAHTLELSEAVGLGTYIPEPRRPHRLRWTDKPAEYQHAVYGNRRRIKRAKRNRWQRPQERVMRTDLCPRVQQRRHAAELAEGSRQSDEAILDRSRRAQFASHPVDTRRSGRTNSLQGEDGLATLMPLIAGHLKALVMSCCPDAHSATRVGSVAA